MVWTCGVLRNCGIPAYDTLHCLLGGHTLLDRGVYAGWTSYVSHDLPIKQALLCFHFENDASLPICLCDIDAKHTKDIG